MMRKMKKLIIPVILCGILRTCVGADPNFKVNIDPSGSYSLVIDNVPWLSSGHTGFRHGGKLYSVANNSLTLLNSSVATGTDSNFGAWESKSFVYGAGQVSIMATIKSFTDPKRPMVIFSQKYLGNASQTSAHGKDLVISQFPSFHLAPVQAHLGYMVYGGNMAGYSSMGLGVLNSSSNFPTGIRGGPVVFFDNTSHALVITPFSQFMAASNTIDNSTGQIHWGIMGLVDRVPKDYSLDFIVYHSNRGVNEAMRGWGKVMRRTYKKDTSRRDSDPTVKYLGYWTDNGAYYYYNTVDNKNYQDTIIDAVAHINTLGIPFKYLQFDSWWYPKGHKRGCTTWEPLASIFPDGFKALWQKTKLPFGCHNRYWDSETTYAKYNGGKYNFIKDASSGYAVPDDDQFWLHLFNVTQEWGEFILYEQDWLDQETDLNNALLSDLNLGRRWLLGMGKGADAFTGINIQYCMAYARHILQSLEIPAVTQARVSGDYQPGSTQWKIGKTAMFAEAVALASFKDTYWTTSVQDGSPYSKLTYFTGSTDTKKEYNTGLHNAVSTLSAGPVGPGDGIGYMNKTLLMRCCDASGQILKPSRTVMAIDDQVKKQAFKAFYSGPDGQVYTTYSNVSSFLFGIILVADLKNSYSLTPSSGWTSFQLPTSMVYATTDSTKAKPVAFSESQPVNFHGCTTTHFCLYHTSPVIELSGDKVVLMGEVDKYVPLSPQRVKKIEKQSDDVVVYLDVQAKEKVVFSFYLASTDQVEKIACDNSLNSVPALRSIISVAKKVCTMAMGG